MRTFNSDKSSNIKAVGYDEDTLTLYVEFVNGGRYTYEGVPLELFDAFKEAESKGRFFFQNIKGKFNYSRLFN